MRFIEFPKYMVLTRGERFYEQPLKLSIVIYILFIIDVVKRAVGCGHSSKAFVLFGFVGCVKLLVNDR